MSELIQAFFMLIGLIFVVGCCAAAFTFAIATVCRWMKWAPINITVNIERAAFDAEE